jgi:heat shock protein HtpX
MTLYTQASENIQKTWTYMAVFFLFVILVAWVFSYALNAPFILWFAVLYTIITSFVSYWYSDKIVLSMTGAREIKKQDNPELYRLVENLCITAGLPIPKIYIMNEAQPNAFATGRDPKHGAIAVTTGLLERLERAELEGVIAHEMSHIGNRDALLQTVVVILAGIVVLMSDFFFRISFWGGASRDRDDRKEGGMQLFMLIFAIALAILAPLLATIIKLAISRKREFLADASGALLTRYPEGLASALQKISSDQHPLRVANNSTSHLFIASPFRGKQGGNWFSKLFMTHPPIEERINALMGMKI